MFVLAKLAMKMTRPMTRPMAEVVEMCGIKKAMVRRSNSMIISGIIS